MPSLKFFFLLMLIIFCLSAKSQIYVGVESGIAKNAFSADISDLSYTTKKSLYGIALSIPVDYKINNLLSIRSSVSYVQKKYSLDRTGDFKGIYQEFKNSYFQTPLSIAVQKEFKELSFFLNAGVYGAYWNHGTVRGAIPDIYSVSNDGINKGTE